MTKQTKVYMKSLKTGEVFITSNPDWHSECEKLTAKAGPEELRLWYCKRLREMIKPGQEVSCVLRHVSKSGMSRDISLLIAGNWSKSDKKHPEVINISHMAAVAMGRRHNDDGAITIGGCGMDMGFELVYSLGHALWPNGTKKPHGVRNGEDDHDGGYALKHRWI